VICRRFKTVCQKLNQVRILSRGKNDIFSITLEHDEVNFAHLSLMWNPNMHLCKTIPNPKAYKRLEPIHKTLYISCYLQCRNLYSCSCSSLKKDFRNSSILTEELGIIFPLETTIVNWNLLNWNIPI
jgi:hypothetical protein